MSRKAAFALAAVLSGLSPSGCTPVQQGRMGPWAAKPLWGTCKCMEGTALLGIGNRSVNTSFEGGDTCGGENDEARNQWCAQQCQAKGFAQGEYLMCLK